MILTRTYERDYSGLVTKINRPRGRYTRYCYDKLGRVIRTDYYDKTYENFTYNKNGALIEVENQYGKVKFERDSLGRITKEWQGRHWISNQYDELGNCIQTVSSFGANILTSRNEMGQATQVAAYLDKEKPWVSRMEYNALGQETQRLFSNNICSAWDYDKAGRPIFHEVSNQRSKADAAHQGIFGNVVGWSDTLRRHRYEWDVNYQLKEVTNGLTKGTTVYSYDQFSNLVSAKESGFETIFRSADIVGNLYETKDCSDRIYGAGSRLEKSCINLKEKRNKYQGGYGKLITKGRQFFYDEEGNLAKKIEPDGGTWTYRYFGNGMLREVTRPDKSCVSFQYDTFGRRIEKSVTSIHSKGVSEGRQQKVIRFLWNGNNLFHEWEEKCTVGRRKTENKVDFKADYILKLEKREEEKAKKEAGQGENIPDNLITWVFQDDFIPRGKITKDGNYSIISDYLGTPVEAYDEEGKKVWERNLDIYGRVKTEEALGKKNFIPFRFQGQYEDEETELYYNRFRYYDSQQGQYTQQDPIGLAGGNPTLYGYVYDTLCELDPFGLGRMPSWMTTRKGWQRHHLIPVSVWDKYFIPQEAGMNVNGATNMTYLPVAQGIDLVNPNSSLHVGWNNVHSEYNQYISQELDTISRLAKENNWGKRKIQKEIRMLQSEVKKNLKKGVIKCH